MLDTLLNSRLYVVAIVHAVIAAIVACAIVFVNHICVMGALIRFVYVAMRKGIFVLVKRTHTEG